MYEFRSALKVSVESDSSIYNTWCSIPAEAFLFRQSASLCLGNPTLHVFVISEIFTRDRNVLEEAFAIIHQLLKSLCELDQSNIDVFCNVISGLTAPKVEKLEAKLNDSIRNKPLEDLINFTQYPDIKNAWISMEKALCKIKHPQIFVCEVDRIFGCSGIPAHDSLEAILSRNDIFNLAQFFLLCNKSEAENACENSDDFEFVKYALSHRLIKKLAIFMNKAVWDELDRKYDSCKHKNYKPMRRLVIVKRQPIGKFRRLLRDILLPTLTKADIEKYRCRMKDRNMVLPEEVTAPDSDLNSNYLPCLFCICAGSSTQDERIVHSNKVEIKFHFNSDPIYVTQVFMDSNRPLELTYPSDLKHKGQCMLSLADDDSDLSPRLFPLDVLRNVSLGTISWELSITGHSLLYSTNKQELEFQDSQEGFLISSGPLFSTCIKPSKDSNEQSYYRAEVLGTVISKEDLTEENIAAILTKFKSESLIRLIPTDVLLAVALLISDQQNMGLSEPLLTDFCPPKWRIESPRNICCDSLYWKKRLLLAKSTSSKLSGDRNGAISEILCNTLDDVRSRTRTFIGLLESEDFKTVVNYCQQGDLFSGFWRPVMHAFRVSQSNLTAVRNRLFELQAAQTLSLIYLTFTERLQVAQLVRLLSPFTGDTSMLRILIDKSSHISEDISMSPLAPHVFEPCNFEQTVLTVPELVEYDKDCPLETAIIKSGIKISDILSDTTLVYEQNFNLLNELLEHITSSTPSTVLSEPSEKCTYFIVHPDRQILNFIRKEIGEDRLTQMDCVSPSFYEEIDSMLLNANRTLRSQNDERSFTFWLISSFELLSSSEKKALYHRLANIPAQVVFFSKSLDSEDFELFSLNIPKSGVNLYDFSRNSPVLPFVLLSRSFDTLTASKLAFESILQLLLGPVVHNCLFTEGHDEHQLLNSFKEYAQDNFREDVFQNWKNGIQEFHTILTSNGVNDSVFWLGQLYKALKSKYEYNLGVHLKQEMRKTELIKLSCLPPFQQLEKSSLALQFTRQDEQVQVWFQSIMKLLAKHENDEEFHYDVTHIRYPPHLHTIIPIASTQSMPPPDGLVFCARKLPGIYLEELLLRSAQCLEEFDWNKLPDVWGNSPMSMVGLLRILRITAYPLHVVLTIPAKILDTLLQSANVTQSEEICRILFLHDQNKKSSHLVKSLLQTGDGKFSMLAVLLFHLRNKCRKGCAPSLQLKVQHIRLMLTATTFFRIQDEQDAKKLLQTLRSVDEPKALFLHRQELSNIICDTVSATDMDDIFAKPLDIRGQDETQGEIPEIGAALVHYISACAYKFPDTYDTSRNIFRTKLGRTICNLYRQNDMGGPFIEQEVLPFSKAAWGVLLSSTTSQNMDRMIELLRYHGREKSHEILFTCYFDKVFPVFSIRMLISMLSRMCIATKNDVITEYGGDSMFVPTLYDMLAGRKEACESIYQHPKYRHELPLHLPELKDFRRRYVTWVIESVYEMITANSEPKSIMSSIYGSYISGFNSEVVTCLLEEVERLIGNFEPVELSSACALTYLVLWITRPSRQFVIDLGDDIMTTNWSAFKETCSTLRLFDNLKDVFIPPLFAIYLVKPQTLELAIFLSFEQKVAHLENRQLSKQNFIVGQKQNRPLSVTAYHQHSDGRQIFRKAKQKISFCDLPTYDSIRAVLFAVHTGCNLDIMVLNLKALGVLCSKSRCPKAYNHATENDEQVAANCQYVVNLLLLWFQLLQISPSEVYDFIRDLLEDDFVQINPMLSRESYLSEPALIPPPSVIDVHLRSTRSLLVPFGTKDEDQEYTKLYLSLIGEIPDSEDLFLRECAIELSINFGRKFAAEPSSNQEFQVCLFMLVVQVFYRFGETARQCAREMLNRCLEELHQSEQSQVLFFRFAIRGLGFVEDPTEIDREDMVSLDSTNQLLLKQIVDKFLEKSFKVCLPTFYEVNFCATQIYSNFLTTANLRQLKINCDGEMNTTLSNAQPLCYISNQDGPDFAQITRGEVEINTGVNSVVRQQSLDNRDFQHDNDELVFFMTPNLTRNDHLNSESSETIQGFEGPVSLKFGSHPIVVRMKEILFIKNAFDGGDGSDNDNVKIDACLLGIRDGEGGVLCAERIKSGQEACVHQEMSTFKFFPTSTLYTSKSAQILIEDGIVHASPREDTSYRILQTFSSHRAVWQHLVKFAPPGSLLVGDGILLKRCHETLLFRPILPIFRTDSYFSQMMMMETLNNYGLICELVDALHASAVLSVLEMENICGVEKDSTFSSIFKLITNGCRENIFDSMDTEAFETKFSDFVCNFADDKIDSISDAIKQNDNIIASKKDDLCKEANAICQRLRRCGIYQEELKAFSFLIDPNHFIYGDDKNELLPVLQRWCDADSQFHIQEMSDSESFKFVSVPNAVAQGPFQVWGYLLFFQEALGSNDLISQPEFVNWLAKVLIAPIPQVFQQWFFQFSLFPLIARKPPTFDSQKNVSQHIICFALSDTCCEKSLRCKLLSVFACPIPIKPFFEHVSEVYGIYIVHSRILYILKSVYLIPIHVIDANDLRARGIVTKDHIYSTIVSSFRGRTLIVYVRGFNAIDDLLLKWCAEHTKAIPFHYIFFEQLDTSRNLSENRDRCNKRWLSPISLEELQLMTSLQGNSLHKQEHGAIIERGSRHSSYDAVNNCGGLRSKIETVEYRATKHLWERKPFDEISTSEKFPPHTKVIGNWKYDIRNWLEEERTQLQQAFIIFSPPGAGKTRFMEKTLIPRARELQFKDYYFDCSNSRLVEENLTSLLEEVSGGSPAKTLLVIDEYHMLSRVQKREVFDYLKSRKKTIYAIIIGNRKEKEDDDFVAEWSSKNVQIKQVSCRLPLCHLEALIHEENKHEQREHINKVIWWYGICRFLFSDDVLTFRNRQAVLDAVAGGANSRTLGKILFEKAPFLGLLLCERISFYTTQFFDQYHSMENKKALKELLKESDGNPFSLLTRAGLVSFLLMRCQMNSQEYSDSSLLEGYKSGLEQDKFVLPSFPECCYNLQQSHCIPPVVRLLLWCQHVFRECLIWLNPSEKTPDLPSFKTLRQLYMIDQPCFPLVTHISADFHPFSSGKAFAESGDYTDLEWIRLSLQRNAAISWGHAQSIWAKHFVSDIIGITRLLEEAPDPLGVIAAFNPDNLCGIIQANMSFKSGKDFCIAISRTAVKMNFDFESGLSDLSPQNPILLAAWVAYDVPFNDIFPTLSSSDSNCDAFSKCFASLRRKTLLWAAMFSDLKPPTITTPNAATEKLREDLLEVTKELINNTTINGDKYITALWTLKFASLLPKDSNILRSIRPAILYLASTSDPCPSEWPSLMEKIGRTIRLQASQLDLKDLAQDEFFLSGENFCLITLEKKDFGYQAEQQFVQGLLSPYVTVHLPPSIQCALLCTPEEKMGHSASVIPISPTMRYVSQKFGLGLAYLTSEEHILCKKSIRDELVLRYRVIHGAKSDRMKSNIIRMFQDRQHKNQENQIKQAMLHIKRILGVDNRDILKYYNQYLGEMSLHVLKEGNVILDKYKNPKGGQFDLACDSAFKGYRVIIGCFFRTKIPFLQYQFESEKISMIKRKIQNALSPHEYYVTQNKVCIAESRLTEASTEERRLVDGGKLLGKIESEELPLDLLKRNIDEYMKQKGFEYDIETDEDKFCKQLLQQRQPYHVAWVISGSASDFVSDQSFTEKVLNMAHACVEFHKKGKGLFLFGENEPYFLHVNAILRLLYNNPSIDLVGNIRGDNYILRRDYYKEDGSLNDDPILRRKSNGKIRDKWHPITTGLVTLYEGITICDLNAISSMPSWCTIADGGYQQASRQSPKPIIVAKDGIHGQSGRIVIDSGFTKIWINWKEGGTDRYIMNATSWLVGVDLRYKAIPHAEQQNLSHVSQGISAAHRQWIRDAVQSAVVSIDLICVVDLSGSMTSFFEQLKRFLRDMISSFSIGNTQNRMGIIGFGSNSRVFHNMASDAAGLNLALQQFNCLGGTNFVPALNQALQMIRSQCKGNHRRILMFQTDGANGDDIQSVNALARNIIQDHNTTLYAVVVGSRQAASRVQGMVGPAGNYPPSDPNEYIMFINDYHALQREAHSVAQRLQRAT